MADPKYMAFDQQQAVDRGTGAMSYPLVTAADGAQNFTAGISSFEPGVNVPMHCHNTEEMVTVLEGSGECVIDGVTRPVNQFDATLVPANMWHCFRNTGSTRMRILWVYGSRTVTRTFFDTGITVDHLSPSDVVGGSR